MKATLQHDGTITVGIHRVLPGDPRHARLMRAVLAAIDGDRFAVRLAQEWTQRDAEGDEPGPDEMAAASARLELTRYVVESVGMDGWRARPAQSVSLSQGGVIAAGKVLRGGRWVDLAALSETARRDVPTDPGRSRYSGD